MGIRDLLSAHDARFISVDELLAAVAKEEGVTIEEAARAFSIKGLLGKLEHRLCSHADGDYVDSTEGSAFHMLEWAANPGRMPWASHGVESELNFGEPGFFRDEIAAVLKESGFAVPPCLIEQASSTEVRPDKTSESATCAQNKPDLRPFVMRANITICEAADILREANGGDWWAALEDAVDSDQIKAGTWGAYRGDQPLSHADLRAWCEAGGFVWPVPLPPAPPTLEKLCQAAYENGRSVIELEILRRELEAVTEERDQIRADLERQRTAPNQNQAARSDGWTKHSTKLFNLLPTVIAMAKQERSWPKQEGFVAELMAQFGLTQAEAKALDAVTRPDELRRK